MASRPRTTPGISRSDQAVGKNVTPVSALSEAVRSSAPDNVATPSPTAGSGDGRLFTFMIGGYPLAWALGFAPIIWVASAALMVLWLMRNRPIQVPPGTILYALFLIVVGSSIIQITSFGKMAVWVLRASWYVSGLVAWLYLIRQTAPEARVKIIRSFIVLWIATVVGGYAAIVVPELAWRTPLAAVLPGVIASQEFVSDLINPRVAEIQVFPWTGVVLNRPAAPYAYTNGWGSSMALLTPFVIGALQEPRLRIARWKVVLMLAAAMVPFYVALNRGAWLTLGVGLVYGIVRYSLVNRKILPILIMVGLGFFGTVGALSTGVLNTAIEQLETRSEDSNETRGNLYVETIRYTAESPLIGFGSTRTNPSNPAGPPLGTHGQLWSVMFAHGYLGLILYTGFFIFGFVRARGRSPVANWARVTLLIGLLQLPIYGHLPVQLFIMIAAVAISAWPSDALQPELVPEPELGAATT